MKKLFRFLAEMLLSSLIVAHKIKHKKQAAP